MAKIRSVLDARSHLGETPVWDDARAALWWIDIYKPTINRFDPGTGINREIVLDQSVHAIALRRNGGIVASLQHGFGFIDPESGAVEIVADPLAGAPVKFNDGKSDRQGRFWSGSMANDWTTPIGGLHRLDADRTVRTLERGIKLANGLGWSPDDRTLYFTDFARSTIFAYDYDGASGAISNRRVLITVPAAAGQPDGMTVDRDGHLWIALWDGWAVAQFDAAGRLLRKIGLPAQRPTSCSFGGPDLATLYVTSATMLLDDAALAAQPLAGSLFAIDEAGRGLPEPRFAG